MSVKQVVENLKKEIKEKNRKDAIDSMEEILSENVQELLKTKIFFQLPLKNIFSVVSKINFNSIDECDNGFEVLQNIIKNTINAHDEKETLLIFYYINSHFNTYDVSYESIFSLIALFTKCSFFQYFNKLYLEEKQLPTKDYDYEIDQAEQEIGKLEQQLKVCEQEIERQRQKLKAYEKPNDLELDIFKACKEGKLSSVKWLIEYDNVDKTKSVRKNNYKLQFFEGDTPIHIASKNGHLPIVQYLIEDQKVDKDIKGSEDRTPLHYASEQCHLPIVQYLISKDAKIESKDTDGWTPLQYASLNGKTEIVKYLVSKGANKNYKNSDGQTSYDVADNDEIRDILK